MVAGCKKKVKTIAQNCLLNLFLLFHFDSVFFFVTGSTYLIPRVCRLITFFCNMGKWFWRLILIGWLVYWPHGRYFGATITIVVTTLSFGTVHHTKRLLKQTSFMFHFRPSLVCTPATERMWDRKSRWEINTWKKNHIICIWNIIKWYKMWTKAIRSGMIIVLWCEWCSRKRPDPTKTSVRMLHTNA